MSPFSTPLTKTLQEMTARDFTLFFGPTATSLKLNFVHPPRHVQKLQLLSLFYPYSGTAGVFGHFCIQAQSTTQSVGRINKNSCIYQNYASGIDVIFPYLGSCPITLPADAGTFAYEFGHDDVTAYNPPLLILNDLTFEVEFIEGRGLSSSIGVTALKSVVLTVRITAEEWGD